MGKYRKLPFGYRMEMGTIVIDPDEAKWIVYIIRIVFNYLLRSMYGELCSRDVAENLDGFPYFNMEVVWRYGKRRNLQ